MNMIRRDSELDSGYFFRFRVKPGLIFESAMIFELGMTCEPGMTFELGMTKHKSS